MEEILLATQNLSVGYTHNQQKTVLFENINLTLAKGQLICFMGPNGVGKSTLIRSLAGLQKVISGAIHTSQGSVGKQDSSQTLSVVLTDRIPVSNMTSHELIVLGRYPYLGWSIQLTNADKQIIHQAISQTHVQSLLDKKLYELSDGQLQLIMITRALAQDTPIILLDEPTAHLDLNNRVEIMNLLRTLSHTTGKGILVSTHELDLALQTADRIWLAGTHKRILSGLPEDLVLDGSFDRIFQFKGFDLKTGKVHHEAHRQVSINLTGYGHEYLWTKNALERTGYSIHSDSTLTITICKTGDSLTWEFKKESFQSLQQLLSFLEKNPV